MIAFLTVFAVAIITLLAVQSMDVECARPQTRRRPVFVRKIRVPFRLSFRQMLGGEAR